MEKKVHYRLKRKEKATNLKDRLKYIFVETNKVYELLEGIDYVLSNHEQIHIPVGFETDLRSVPPFLWGICPPFGNFLLGAIVHDYLYVTKDKRGRKFADMEMLRISNKLNKNKLDNYTRYFAVRIFGGLYWNDIIK